MRKMIDANTFGKYKFELWVTVDVAQQIIDFWGCFGRTYKDWLESGKPYTDDGSFPSLGENVIFFKSWGGKIERVEGRFIHAWNNMGRVITKDMKSHVVSTCDEWFYCIDKPKEK